jgi:hypothetical protein
MQALARFWDTRSENFEEQCLGLVAPYIVHYTRVPDVAVSLRGIIRILCIMRFIHYHMICYERNCPYR